MRADAPRLHALTATFHYLIRSQDRGLQTDFPRSITNLTGMHDTLLPVTLR